MVFTVEQNYFTILIFPFILGLFIFFLYKWVHTKPYLATKNLPPSPPKLPILGNLHQLGWYLHHSLSTLSQKYGELMIIYFGKTPFLIVSSSNAAREILKQNDLIFANRPYVKTAHRLFYNGKDLSTTQYGEHWKQLKSICVLHLLSNKRVASYYSVREQELVLLMEKIGRSVGLSINLSDLLSTYTKDVLSRVAFGRRYSGNEGQRNMKKVLEEFNELLVGVRVGDFVPWLSWINRIDGSEARVKRVIEEIDQFLEQMLKQHEDRYQKEEGSLKDFVDVLLEIEKEKTNGFFLRRDSIKALMLNMYIGGNDTTFTVLEWAMTELLRHPTIMQELKKEVRGISSQKSNINDDDLKQMKYLNAVIKETLRLHPPTSFFARLSTKDVKINGYEIPSGTATLVNIWKIQRDPNYWENPDRFNPERFLNSSIDFRGQDFDLIPFGSGRRICPGLSFSMAVIELALANIMLKFDWDLPGDVKGAHNLDMSECIGLTMHRKTPLFAVAATHI